jgi:hypothetical protein
MVRYLARAQFAGDYQARPEVGAGEVTQLVPSAVREVLAVAETWLGWDGAPIRREGNAWTPHKALRRTADHLLDHLAEIQCRLAGQPTLPDVWPGRMVTLDPRPGEDVWTLREIVHHVSGVTAYADMVGRLG